MSHHYINTSTNQLKPGAIIIEGHVQGLSNTRSLGEMGIPVYVVDKNNCIARYSKYCLKFFRSPDFIDDKFADFLIKLAIEENLNSWVLIPSNDHAVYTIAKHKEKLNKYYKTLVPNLNVLNSIYDKVNLINIAKKIAIPVPKTICFNSTDNIDHDLSFPVLTKGRQGLTFYKQTGKKAFLSKDKNSLQKQLKIIESKNELKNSFTQELIPDNGKNKTISFTAFCIDGEIYLHWTGIKLREHPIRFGTATFAKNTNSIECFNLSKLLLKELNYTGVCEIEFIFDPRDNKYKLIEINPRTWLWVELAKVNGIDYAKLIYDYLNKVEIMKSSPDNKEVYWINPFTDTVYSILSILTGKLNFFSYLNSLTNKMKISALFWKKDPKPGWMYLIKMFSFVKSR